MQACTCIPDITCMSILTNLKSIINKIGFCFGTQLNKTEFLGVFYPTISVHHSKTGVRGCRVKSVADPEFWLGGTLGYVTYVEF